MSHVLPDCISAIAAATIPRVSICSPFEWRGALPYRPLAGARLYNVPPFMHLSLETPLACGRRKHGASRPMETACSISKVDREVGRRGSTSRTALHPWQAKNGRLRALARTTFELSQSEARVWLAGRSTDRPASRRSAKEHCESFLRRECLSCRGRKSRHREQRGQQQFAAAVPTSRTQEPRVLHGSVGAGASHPTSWKVVATPACLRPGVAWRVMAHDNLFFGPGT